MKISLYLLLLCLAVQGLNAQISGRVMELNAQKDRVALPAALLHWKNTSFATQVDVDGRFNIPKIQGQDTLIVSSLGYTADTLIITDSTAQLDIVLSNAILLRGVDVRYESTGSELSYLNPMKVEILNERSLMKAACCNLSESFETNPSIDVNFADAVSGTKQIQMLGLSGQYAMITKENMPYLRGLSNGYGLTFIPGTWIQSIQLSKGAGSVVNGYESFTGQINTELQNPEHSDRLNFNAYGNQNGRNEYNLNLSQRFNSSFSTGLLTHMSFNPLVQDMNKDGFADIPTGRQYNILNKYAISTNKGFEAQFGGGYLRDERRGGQFRQILPAAEDTSRLYTIGIDNEKWEVYSKTGFVFKNKPATSMGLQLSYTHQVQNNHYGDQAYLASQGTLYANYIFQSILGNTNHTYKLGASFLSDDWNERYRNYQFTRMEQDAGIFAEYAYSYKQRLNLVAGLRADYHNYYGFFLTPRLHLRYGLNNNKTVFRLSAGRALKTANIFAENTALMASSRQWVIQSNNTSMPYGLQAESGWNYGLNFTQKFRLNYRDAYVTVDVYRTDFDHQVILDTDHSTQEVVVYVANGNSYSNTAQAEFGWELRKRLHVRTAYRYVDTRLQYAEGLRQKPFVSRHRAFINFAYETKDKHWQFDFTTQYNGSKRLPVTAGNPLAYQRAETSPAFFNVLTQISYLLKIKQSDLHIYVGAENLLDYRQDTPIVAAEQPFGNFFDASMVWGPIYGRMLYAGLRFKIQ